MAEQAASEAVAAVAADAATAGEAAVAMARGTVEAGWVRGKPPP